MAGDGWDTVAIQQLLDDGVIVAHKDGNYGSSYPRANEFGDTGVPFLTAKLLDDAGHIDFSSAPRLSQEKANQLAYGFIQANDVLLSHNATIGRVAIVPALDEPVLIGTSLTYFRLDQDRLLPRYLAAFFRGRGFQNQLNAVMSHSTRNQVPITDQRTLTVVVPPLAEQATIAEYLEMLDGAIDANRQMNQVLEEMARAIFKAWFVDFEPVKAKQGGATSFPGMPQAIFDKLPDAFQASDIGPTPLGWDVAPVGDVLKITMGQSPPSKHYNEEGRGLPFHQGVRYYGFRFPTHQIYCDLEARIADAGDVLISVRAPVGRINVADRRMVIGRGLAAAKHLSGCSSYALYLLKNLFTVEDAVGDGTIYKAVTKTFLHAMNVIRPPRTVVKAAENLLSPIDAFVACNEREARAFSEMRDALLPKLLTGNMRLTLSRDEGSG